MFAESTGETTATLIITVTNKTIILGVVISSLLNIIS